jgi:hypothetical protein
MKGFPFAIVGVVLMLIGWWLPWYEIGSGVLGSGAQIATFGTFEAVPVQAMFLICAAAVVGLTIYAAVKNERLALAFAGMIALLIVGFELLVLVSAAPDVVSERGHWLWGIIVSFAGSSLMLWGVFAAWVDSQTGVDLDALADRIGKLERETREVRRG